MIKIKTFMKNKNIYIFQSTFKTQVFTEKISAPLIAAVIVAARHRCFKVRYCDVSSIDEMIAMKAAIMAYEADRASLHLAVKLPVMSPWKLAARIRM